MKKIFTLLFSLAFTFLAEAQNTRYLDEIFTEVTVTSDIEYGVNATVLTLPQFGEAVPESLKLDIFQPVGDTETNRPLMLVFHNGNFLPIVTNGQISGHKLDNSVIDMCTSLAKRGYVAAAVDYRLGWNPFAETQPLRALGIIQAAYRGLQDGRNSIRYFRKTVAEDANPYGIDESKISVFGIGTGGYLGLAMGSLDDYLEILNTTNGPAKFILDVNEDGIPETPMIVEAFHGDINGVVETITPTDGFGLPAGDTTNYVNYPTYSSEYNLTIHVGGALGDISWVDSSSTPIITVQSVFDQFAPYDDAVLSVPGQNLDVVRVQSGNVIHEKLEALGLNDIYNDYDLTIGIAATATAEAAANSVTADHDVFPALFPWIRPVNNFGLDEGVVLNWWDPNGATPLNSPAMGAPWNLVPHPTVNPVTMEAWSFHEQGQLLNENMSAEKSRTNRDLVLEFVLPRTCIVLDLPCKSEFEPSSVDDNELASDLVSAFPNPTSNSLSVKAEQQRQMNTINIYNVDGKLVQTYTNLLATQKNIDVTDYTNGLHIMKVYFEDGVVTKKVMIQK